MKTISIILILVLGACSRNLPTETKSQPLQEAPRNHLVVTTTDYKEGLLEVVDLTNDGKNLESPIHSDAVARAPQGSKTIFVLNRFLSDSILALSEDLKLRKANYSLGAESNPQDMVWLNENQAWVSRLHSPDLLLIDPASGKELDKISFKDVADEDGIPELAWMARDGNQLAVEVQRLNKFFPTEASYIAVVDLQSRAVTKHRLARTNPVTEIKQGPEGDWYVGEAGWTGKVSKQDGVIERLARATFAPFGTVANEQNLGGDIVDFEILPKELGVAIVAKGEKNFLVKFKLYTGGETEVLLEADKYQFHQLLVDRARGLFYLADRHPTQFGIRVFSIETLKEIPESKRGLHFPPYHMSWMD